MAEITFCERANRQARSWLEDWLRNSGAAPVSDFGGVAGSVDAHCDVWRWPNGDELRVWSDNYTALSVSGAAQRLTGAHAAFMEVFGDG